MIILLLAFAASSFVFAAHSLADALAADDSLLGPVWTASQSIVGWARSGAVSIGLSKTPPLRTPDATRHEKSITRKACVLKV